MFALQELSYKRRSHCLAVRVILQIITIPHRSSFEAFNDSAGSVIMSPYFAYTVGLRCPKPRSAELYTIIRLGMQKADLHKHPGLIKVGKRNRERRSFKGEDEGETYSVKSVC